MAGKKQDEYFALERFRMRFRQKRSSRQRIQRQNHNFELIFS